MRGLPQKQNARRADKIRLCGHLRRYKKIVKKTYIILYKAYIDFIIQIIPKHHVIGDETGDSQNCTISSLINCNISLGIF